MTYLSKKELANLYKVSAPTFRRMLLSIPQLSAKGREKLVSPADCNLIFEKFGNPKAE